MARTGWLCPIRAQVLSVPVPDRHPIAPMLLATSLYDNPAAELHEDASARLGEHPALPTARSCAGPRPASGVSGYQVPAGGHEEGAVANHRERPVSRDTALRISCRTPSMRRLPMAGWPPPSCAELPVLSPVFRVLSSPASALGCPQRLGPGGRSGRHDSTPHMALEDSAAAAGAPGRVRRHWLPVRFASRSSRASGMFALPKPTRTWSGWS